MSCAHPLTAFVNAEGRCPHFVQRQGFDSARTMFLRCRQCAMCRRARALDLYIRLVHESYTCNFTCCLTATYGDDELDSCGSLRKRDWVLYMKRLRERVSRRGDGELRFNVIGEYSPELLRPHLHAAIFGYWPSDAERWNKSQAGRQQYVSEELAETWGHGHVTFQPASPGAFGYMARHDSWKLTGSRDISGPVFDEAGAYIGYREPEFWLASRRPGLGAEFCDRYGEEMIRSGFTVIDGERMNVPAYYLQRLEKRFPQAVSELKARYELDALARMSDETRERLAVREEVAIAGLSRKARNGVAR